MALLQGKLTKISAAVIAITQLPNMLSDLLGTPGAFSAAVEQPFSVIALAGAAGVIWGGVRRAFNYFQNGIFGLKVVRSGDLPYRDVNTGKMEIPEDIFPSPDEFPKDFKP